MYVYMQQGVACIIIYIALLESYCVILIINNSI